MRSQNATDPTAGRPHYVRTCVGGVGVWSLRLTHAGNGTPLHLQWWIYPDRGSRASRAVLDGEGECRRAAVSFAALGLDDAHQHRHVEYFKTRKYIVDSWKQSRYDDETRALAARIGLQVRDAGCEIDGDATVGQSVGWAPVPY